MITLIYNITMLWEMAILQNRCPITQLRRPLTYKDMTLYPHIKVMALYLNESFSVRKINNYKKLYV